MTIKKIGLALLLIISISFAFSTFAQGRELEIEYPEVRGEKPEETTIQVPNYVKYIFNFAIWISGVIALGTLIYGGFKWFTSAGSPERIQDAKDQISAAILGLVILFGSYLILISINPNLVVFKLKRLRPIISELPAGILVCKEQPKTANGDDAVERAWYLITKFKYQNPNEEQMLKIKEELDLLLDDIALKCYPVSGAGDIIADFEDKVTDIYFIPSPPAQKGGRIVQYGAVLYEERGYKGNSKTYAKHFEKPGVTIYDIEHKKIDINSFKLSSIKPFVSIWPPNPYAKVTLYQETNYNKDLPQITPISCQLSLKPCCPKDMKTALGIYNQYEIPLRCDTNPLSFSPKSIKIEGDLLVILIAKDTTTQASKSEVFFAENDANLEDNENIVEWVDCRDYQSGTSKQCTGFTPAPMGGGASFTYQCCAKAAARRMLIISAKPY